MGQGKQDWDNRWTYIDYFQLVLYVITENKQVEID